MSNDANVTDVTIFHNPACSHSRGALDILNEQAVEYELIEYLITPPSRETLEMIISKLVDPVTELIRTADTQFVSQGFDAADYKTEEEIVDFLLAHPELMQRPIIIKGDAAVIARPSDRVAEVLG